jgi:hypothetical protein
MLERGTENGDGVPIQQALPGTVITARFARDNDHFAVRATTSNRGAR